MKPPVTRAELRDLLRALPLGASLTLETTAGHPNASDRVHVNLREAADRVPGRFSVRLDKHNGTTTAKRTA